MPRAKATEPEITHFEKEPEYALEPIDTDLEQQLNALGSSMKIFKTRTAEKYPGWSHMMSDLFEIIRDAKETMTI